MLSFYFQVKLTFTPQVDYLDVLLLQKMKTKQIKH